MKKIAAIAGLTWKSAFRYRLFWIMAGLLAAAVVGLPLLLKTDGTAKGLVQILLTYTLSAVAALLGFATLWLSCGTLARDVEECQVQMVAVKPIARWQIWLGKWLGLLALNAVLLALAGAAIFFVLQWRAAKLPADQQKILRDDIFVSRASAREPPLDLGPEVERIMRQRVKDPSQMDPRDLAEIRLQLTAALTTNFTEVPPGLGKRWCIDLHSLRERLRDQPLLLRVKFHAANANPEAQFGTIWLVGPANSPRRAELTQSLPSDSFQEFPVPAGLLDEQGRLWIDVVNPNERRPGVPGWRGPGAALSREHLWRQFHPRPGHRFLLAGLAGLHRHGGGQFSFLSGGCFRLAGAVDDRFLQRHGLLGGGARHHHRLRRGQRRIRPHAGGPDRCADFPGRAQDHQAGAKFFAHR